MLKVAGIYCRHPEDRRDLVQEICAHLWRAFPRYDDRRSFSTWMYRIALNVAISEARRAGYRSRHVSTLSDVELAAVPDPSSFEPDDRVRALHRIINELDDLNRALLLLYLEDRTYREIADVLGISETNVATKLSRLKRRIRNDFFDEPIQRQREENHGARRTESRLDADGRSIGRDRNAGPASSQGKKAG